MRWGSLIAGLIVAIALIWGGTKLYTANWSPGAQAKRVVGQVMAAATTGDVEMVQAQLAPDAAVKASDLVERYQGLEDNGPFAVHKALTPNQTGVTYLVLASVVDRATGVPEAITFAMRREQGRWVVVKAGKSISF